MLAKLPAERQALLAAADYMEKHGFCQRVMRDDAGRVCLLGAIRESSDGVFDAAIMVKRLRDFLQVDSIHGWNNAPGRTQAEAVAALRAAAMHGL